VDRRSGNRAGARKLGTSCGPSERFDGDIGENASVTWILIALAGALLIYLGAVLALMVLGRRTDARAVAGFVPDCVVLCRRLLADSRVPRRHKALLAGLLGYLASPLDLIPDFIPVIGQLDDVLIAAVVLRTVRRGVKRSILRRHWPGPPQSLRVIERLASRRS
jgi:uncharacterized membrane protein YkvA (DUF1232 family)